MITVRDLTVRFGEREALRFVTLTVPAGQRVALVGPNGAGKTTLLRALLALIPYEGAVAIGGHDARAEGLRARALVGYVPQTPAFPPHLTTGEVVAYVQEIRGLPADPLPVLARVGLDREAATPVGHLSGGMGRRLALAVARVGDPPVILMDEPASHLDAGGEGLLRAWLEEAQAEGRTVLVATHHLNGLQSLVDRVVLLEEGAVRADAAMETVRSARWLELTTSGPLPVLPDGVIVVSGSNGTHHLRVRDGALGAVLEALGRRPVDIHEPALLDVLREATR
ncbi:MAG: ABC transporter ATP-binding protein [Armatimonadota bacterium]|nr:ABC transporter ATP-binding protein [Armatimonadota bacterium]MDR7450551.1 ABC transporter ATP-binding protein [Armatimonadota bacterium]MDR7466316.1 ABC transporter ATP-binding protein [Armatimonadota bacterium]MDR7493037.1 ABC transporter ATP-binding protein [Armatimonadota bacterium]MDR7498206.1 ABC transporter ATP-binding protein [Armatimonadota bacterium]